MDEYSYFKYVKITDFIHWLAKGWMIESDLSDTHHGEHAILMKKHD